MKFAWDPVTLTRHWWDGPEPVAGDGLKTARGRRYLILSVRGKQLKCLVLPKDAPIEGQVFEWQWSKRTRTRK